MLDDIHTQASDGSIEIVTNHLLAVSCHNSLPWCKVLGGEDGRSDDEGHVRSVDVASLKITATLVTDKDLVTREVGVFVDHETV